MKATLAVVKDRAVYIAHARQHLKEIEGCLPRVEARAKAQERNEPREYGRKGCIKRLKQLRETKAQYEEELEQWEALMRGEEISTLEPIKEQEVMEAGLRGRGPLGEVLGGGSDGVR